MTVAGLQIVERHAQAMTTLALSGELDLFTGDGLIDGARRALRRRPAVLGLDLRDVEFLDVAGARALIRWGGLAAAARVELELAAQSEPVRRLLAVSGLHAASNVPAPPAPRSPTRPLEVGCGARSA